LTLVIEIDGAAYHSSPDAVARDEARDAYLKSYDYTILRIPAKVVFSTPLQAVAKVRSALAEGRRAATPPDRKEQAAAQKPASARAVLGDLLRATGKIVEDLNTHLERSVAIDKAMAKPEAIFDAEKLAIQSALDDANQTIESEDFCAQSPENRQNYQRAVEFYKGLMKDRGNDGDDMDELRRVMRQRIIPIEAPSPHPNPVINEEITRRCRVLLKDRSEYFEKIRRRMKGDERLGKLVKARLEETGCPSCRDAIFKGYPGESP
jgi:hypothetical protein